MHGDGPCVVLERAGLIDLAFLEGGHHLFVVNQKHTSYWESSLLIQRMAATAPQNSEPREKGCGEDKHRTLVVPSGRKAVMAAAWPDSPEEPSEYIHTRCRPGVGGLVSACAASWHPHLSRDFFSR